MFCYWIYYARKSGLDFLTTIKNILKAKTIWASTLIHKIYLLLISIIYLIVFITSLFSPPNTVDSMTYHMARVANWVQNGNIGFYPTAVLRQLYNVPLAEYSILHLQLLSGNDYFANLVQFFSFVACGVGASLIAEYFKQNELIQLLTVLLTATLPMAILQSSSTQNDLVVSLFVISFFYFFLKASESASRTDFLFAGMSLGLALLAKGTAYFFCFPIGLLIATRYLIYSRLKPNYLRFVYLTFGVVIIAFLFNAGHYARSFYLFGSPLSSGEEHLTNEKITVPIVVSNVVRNYALHIGTNSQEITNLTENLISNLLGSEINNPDSTLLGQSFFIVQTKHEDSAGNMIHIFLLSLSLLFAFYYRGAEEKQRVIIASLTIIAGFFIFCVFLKWQPWASRLQIPLFMLGCPLSALMLSRLSSHIRVLLAVLCFAGCVPFLLRGQPRIFIPDENNYSVFTVSRADQYFANNYSIAPAYLEAAAFIKKTKAQEIGFDLSTDYKTYNFGDWEYPLWVFIKDTFEEKPYIRHVGVKNISNQLDREKHWPEFVISTNAGNIIEGIQYEEVWAKSPVRVLKKR